VGAGGVLEGGGAEGGVGAGAEAGVDIGAEFEGWVLLPVFFSSFPPAPPAKSDKAVKSTKKLKIPAFFMNPLFFFLPTSLNLDR
jgi:hypothetical protein